MPKSLFKSIRCNGKHEQAFGQTNTSKIQENPYLINENYMCLTIWLTRRSAAKIKNVFISLKQEQSFPNDPIYNDSQNCKVPKNTCNKG